MQMGRAPAAAYAARMGRADRIREEISWLKGLSAFCAALDASAVTWLVRNYESAGVVLSAGALVSVVILTAIVAYAVLRMYRYFRILEAS